MRYEGGERCDRKKEEDEIGRERKMRYERRG